MPGTALWVDGFICHPLSPFICLPFPPSLDVWHGSLGGRVHLSPFVSLHLSGTALWALFPFICLPLSPSLDVWHGSPGGQIHLSPFVSLHLSPVVSQPSLVSLCLPSFGSPCLPAWMSVTALQADGFTCLSWFPFICLPSLWVDGLICLPLSPFICLPLSPSLNASLGGRIHLSPFVSLCLSPVVSQPGCPSGWTGMPCTERTEELGCVFPCESKCFTESIRRVATIRSKHFSNRYERHCAAKRERSAMRRKAFAKLKPVTAGDASDTDQ